MNSPIGVNAHLSYIKNWSQFISRMHSLNPSVLVAFIDSDNEFSKIESVKVALPDTRIIPRMYHPHEGAYYLSPDAEHEFIAAPQDLLNRWGRFGRNGYILNLLNEPNGKPDADTLARFHKWVGLLIPAAVQSQTSLAMPAWSRGNPRLQGELWSDEFRPFLELMSKYREFMVINVHEYLPKDAGVIGRYKAGLRWYAAHNLKPPRFVITEYGYDHGEGEAGNLNGYKTRGIPGEKYAQTLIETFLTEYRDDFDAGILLGLAVFCYGHSSPDWAVFDTEDDRGFWDSLLAWKYQPAQIPPTLPPPPPESFPPPAPVRWIPALASLKHGVAIVNLRSTPSILSRDLGDIRNSDSVAYDALGEVGGWWHVKVGQTEGYVSSDYFSPTPQELPAPNPAETDLKRLAVIEAQIQALRAERVAIISKYAPLAKIA